MSERKITPPDDLEVFDKRKPPPSGDPWISRSKSGFFVYNRAAYTSLGEPPAVQYVYSPKTGILGFRPAPPEDEHSYPVYPQGNSKNMQSAAHAFNRHYGLSLGHTLRYRPELIEGTLYIDINDDKAIPVSRKNPRG